MLTSKAKSILRVDFEVQKEKAKLRIANDTLIKEKRALDERRAQIDSETRDTNKAKQMTQLAKNAVYQLKEA